MPVEGGGVALEDVVVVAGCEAAEGAAQAGNGAGGEVGEALEGAEGGGEEGEEGCGGDEKEIHGGFFCDKWLFLFVVV